MIIAVVLVNEYAMVIKWRVVGGGWWAAEQECAHDEGRTGQPITSLFYLLITTGGDPSSDLLTVALPSRR